MKNPNYNMLSEYQNICKSKPRILNSISLENLRSAELNKGKMLSVSKKIGNQDKNYSEISCENDGNLTVDINEHKRTMNSDKSQEISKYEIQGDKKNEVECYVAKSPDDLNEYYKIRYQSYSSEYNFVDYAKEATCEDKNADIIIAKSQGEVVAGCRLMYGDVDKKILTSNEVRDSQSYNYQQLMKKSGQQELEGCYAEISSLVVKKGYRDFLATKKMLKECIEKARSLKCKIAFGIAPLVQCRIYRRVFRSLGVESSISRNYEWNKIDKYNFMKMVPIIINL